MLPSWRPSWKLSKDRWTANTLDFFSGKFPDRRISRYELLIKSSLSRFSRHHTADNYLKIRFHSEKVLKAGLKLNHSNSYCDFANASECQTKSGMIYSQKLKLMCTHRTPLFYRWCTPIESIELLCTEHFIVNHIIGTRKRRTGEAIAPPVFPNLFTFWWLKK